MKLRIDVVIYLEESEYVAHCLQFDLVATALSPEMARQEIIELVSSHLQFALENNIPVKSLYNPAPREYWEMIPELTPMHQNPEIVGLSGKDQTCLDVLAYA